MKYCTKCGKELVDEAVVCVHCGCAVAGATVATNPNDAPSTGLAVLSFFFPLVGLILYVVNMNTSPLKAKSAGKGALIGVIASAVVGVISAIFSMALLGAFFGGLV